MPLEILSVFSHDTQDRVAFSATFSSLTSFSSCTESVSNSTDQIVGEEGAKARRKWGAVSLGVGRRRLELWMQPCGA